MSKIGITVVRVLLESYRQGTAPEYHQPSSGITCPVNRGERPHTPAENSGGLFMPQGCSAAFGTEELVKES